MLFKKSAKASPTNPSSGSGGPASVEQSTDLAASITETAPCQKSVRLQWHSRAIDSMRATVLGEFQRQAALPGFRKGKAPADLVARQYAQSIHDETLQRATQQALQHVTQEHQLKPVGPFELRKATLTENEGLILEATVEVEPAFDLGTYKGIPLNQASADVTGEEMTTALAKLQESMARLVPAGAGQEKTRHVPLLDDELAKDLGFEHLEKLTAHVQAKLQEQKRQAQSQHLESELCNELLRRHTFEVPPRLVQHQQERLTREWKVRLLLSGMSESQVEAEAAKFTQQLQTNAAQRVKLSFILDRIAEQERVTVTQDELVARLWDMARRWKKDPAEVRKTFDAQGLWPSVASAVRQEKTVALLLAAAHIENGSMPSTVSTTV